MADEEVDETVTETKEEVKDETPKTLTEAEVNKRIEAARKQEKDKLYGKIDSLQTTVENLAAAAQAEQEKKDKATADAAAKEETENQAKLSSEDRIALKMQKIEEQLAKESAERVRLEGELQKEREAAELERYRQQVLSGESDIIPELVSGNSKTDIDRSVAFAKSRYQELFQASKSKAEGPNRVTSNMPRPTDPNPAAFDEAELQNSLQNFKVDLKRYKKDPAYRAEMDTKRESMLDQVGSAYQRSVGR